jgi:hypothetical protein
MTNKPLKNRLKELDRLYQDAIAMFQKYTENASDERGYDLMLKVHQLRKEYNLISQAEAEKE